MVDTSDPGAGAGRLRQPVENMLGQEFRRGVDALELRHLVEVAVIERRQHRLERIVRAANVDDNSVVIEGIRDEGCIDHEGRPVQRLRRPEDGALERMGDHDVVANFDGKQGQLLN